MANPFTSCKFDFSVASIDKLPQCSEKEVVFAGRSNSGKSSVINALTAQKHLARSSKTPGRTQLLNFFSTKPNHFLVDLPGYGYAKAPRAVKEVWEHLLTSYLSRRLQICGLVLIMDIRHPLEDRDYMLLDIFLPTQKPIIFLLNKADKLSRHQISIQHATISKEIGIFCSDFHVKSFSATKGLGINSVRTIINNWLL